MPGNFRSGRRRSLPSVRLVEETPRLDVRPVIRAARADEDRTDRGYLSLEVDGEYARYVIDLGAQTLRVELITTTSAWTGEIRLDTRLLPSGGVRYCPVCPGRCGRRADVLFVGKERAAPLLCRRCADVRHRSMYVPKAQRAVHIARRIRERIGGPDYAEPFGPFPPKPRRMAWTKYLAAWQATKAKEALYLADVEARQAKRREWATHALGPGPVGRGAP